MQCYFSGGRTGTTQALQDSKNPEPGLLPIEHTTFSRNPQALEIRRNRNNLTDRYASTMFWHYFEITIYKEMLMEPSLQFAKDDRPL